MVTQKEIAEILGVSRTTVARAINGSPNIKEETKKKILELVSKMNYQKNYIGSTLASRKKKVVAFIVKSKNLFYTEQLRKGVKQVRDEYRDYNFEVEEIITDIDDSLGQILKLKEILKREDRVDGILITPLDKEKIYSILKPYLKEIKVVSMNIELDTNIPCVGSDYFMEGRIAANIINKVLREDEKILVIDNGDDHISSGKYLEGFLSKIDKENFQIVGPFRRNGVEDSVEFLNDILEKDDIKSIYINRYAQNILKKINSKKLKNKDIVLTGIGNEIKKLIRDEVVIATVADSVSEIGYKSGKLIFEMLYKEKMKKILKIEVEPKIIFAENLK